MKALLDTNIIIHRENIRITNKSVGLLYYWLDKLHYDKLIHPYSVEELKKYKNTDMQSLYSVKLESYEVLKTIAPQSDSFIERLNGTTKTVNDAIDNQLLCEVFSGRVDILITEDRGMRKKALALDLGDKVFSINSFIDKASLDNPDLVSYKALMVKKEYIGNINVGDGFFDSLRRNYKDFDSWIAKKSSEEAYVCTSDDSSILGFLYLKTEDKETDYHDITPCFEPKRRLKVGTFKIESTGFRLGERFIKIIFDNAIKRSVDEIYITLFPEKQEVLPLKDLIKRWGFFEYGEKTSKSGTELVMVKRLDKYDRTKTIRENFPVVDYNHKKRFLPIKAQYHTTLLPDSQLNTENGIDFMKGISHRYALQKIYITWGLKSEVREGDILLFYRMGNPGSNKKYSSVVTTVGVIDKVIDKFNNENEYLNYCQDRSVFSLEELKRFWLNHRDNLCIIKFIYVSSLVKRPTLDYLWKNEIVVPPKGPRPFETLTDEQFYKLLENSRTELYVER